MIMKARKLLALLLSAGYLSAVHCRVACSFAMPLAVEQHENGCHRHKHCDPKGHDSKAPCGMTRAPGGEALLPSDAPRLNPQAPLYLISVVPHAGLAVMPLRCLGLKRNHGPPGIISRVLSLSCLSPRAPPAA